MCLFFPFVDSFLNFKRVEREESLSKPKEDQSPKATKQNEKEPMDCSSEGESVGTMRKYSVGLSIHCLILWANFLHSHLSPRRNSSGSKG